MSRLFSSGEASGGASLAKIFDFILNFTPMVAGAPLSQVRAIAATGMAADTAGSMSSS